MRCVIPAELRAAASLAVDSNLPLLARMALEAQERKLAGASCGKDDACGRDLLEETNWHFACLANAMAFDAPQLFLDYIGWLKIALLARGLKSVDVEAVMDCIDIALKKELAEPIAAAAAEYVDFARRQFSQFPIGVESELTAGASHSHLVGQYLELLLARDDEQARRLLLDAMLSGVPASDIYLRVLQPCQREVGRLWQMNRIDVAREHYCTAATQNAIAQLWPYILKAPGSGRRLLVSSAGGELHELGPRMLADLFELHGWNTEYLGAGVPPNELVRLAGQRRPDIIALSATTSFRLSVVEQTIAAVRADVGLQGVKIMVGGPPFVLVPHLWQRLGADGCAAEPLAAIALADCLLAESDKPAPQSPMSQAPRLGALTASPEFGLNEISRLNNELITTHRQLLQANLELKAAREAAESATRAKSAFLSTMSHELRTPMTAILGFAELLAESAVEPRQAEAASVIRRSGEHLLALINDILDLSKVEAGGLEIEHVAFSPRGLIEDAVALLRGRAEQQEIALHVDFATPLPPAVSSDPKRVRQILINLLGNAVKFTERGSIRIAAALRAIDGRQLLELRIADTGIGMTPQQIERLFVPFSQAETSTSRKYGGTGLGLAISKRLAEALGGAISVESALGQGSVFTVTLPVGVVSSAGQTARPREASGDRLQNAANEGGVAGLRILVAEDGMDNQRLLARVLEQAGAIAIFVADGAAAVETALNAERAEMPFDVVLMDMEMPVLNGYEATRQLRKAGYSCPIIALTAYAIRGDREQCLAAGCNDYLIKPIERAALLETLARYG
jgi:signal transduction histidine kinase